MSAVNASPAGAQALESASSATDVAVETLGEAIAENERLRRALHEACDVLESEGADAAQYRQIAGPR